MLPCLYLVGAGVINHLGDYLITHVCLYLIVLSFLQAFIARDIEICRILVHFLQTDCFHIRYFIVVGICPFLHLPVHPADYLTHGPVIRIFCTQRAGKVFKFVTGQDGAAVAERLFVEGVVRVSRLGFGSGVKAMTESDVIGSAPLGLVVFPEEAQIPLRQRKRLRLPAR